VVRIPAKTTDVLIPQYIHTDTSCTFLLFHVYCS